MTRVEGADDREKESMTNSTLNAVVTESRKFTDGDRFETLLRTDCCSLYSSILRIHPNALERCSRIALAHLRDLQSLLKISIVDATFNLADVCDKIDGIMILLRDFMGTGRVITSFIGRNPR